MTKESFVALVHKHFDFLINEFGYIVNREYQSNDQYDSGTLEYHSVTTAMRIEKDRQNILVSMKPLNEPEISRLYLETILDSLTVGRENEFPSGVAPGDYDKALKTYAHLIRENCGTLLKGDFYQWLDMLKYSMNERKRDYHSWSGKELSPDTFRKLEDYIKSKS